MKKIVLLTTGILLLSCSNEELAENQNLIDDIELLSNENELNSDKESAQTTKDTDNDGINDEADVDTDNDGIEDNGTDIDEDGINDEHDDYQNLSDTDLSSTIQQKITADINENHSGETINEVEIENQKIEVELSSGIELIFDLNGNFLRLDD